MHLSNMAEDSPAPAAVMREPFSERMEPDKDLPTTQFGYDQEMQEYTQSLHSNMTDFHYEHGRRYIAPRQQASYPLPNDEQESDRLDLLHKLYEVALFGALHFSPLQDPRRILDLGTGTGIWAIEMADKFPDAQVIGNDLSPIQPKWVPPNVHFEVDDMEQEWIFHERFDFIHARALHNSIRDWPRLMRRALDHLHPGAWAEFVDFDLGWYSPDGSVAPDSGITTTNDMFQRAMRENGMEPSPGPHLDRWMRAAGFADVHTTRLPIPVGTWPADPHLKEVGAWNFFSFFEHFEGMIAYLFTRHYGWSKQECDAIAALCRKEMRDPKTHAYHNLYITYGRKPGGTEPAPPPTPLPTE